MSRELVNRLEVLRADYASVMGSGFEHFYCPFLFRDEKVGLCKGHILNQAFDQDAQDWTVQRQDIDNFFGSRFEAEFTNIRFRGALGSGEALSRPELRRRLQPKLKVGGKEVEFFIPEGKVPEHFACVGTNLNDLPLMALKIDPGDFESALESKWQFELLMDLRVGAFVSMLKAAHLTKFHIFGYRYAFSPVGHFLGWDLLGSLFEKSRGLSVSDAKELAKEHFATSVNMVRPVLGSPPGLAGTVRDRLVYVAWSASGFPWALIVFVPVVDSLHAVMLPVGDSAERMVTYLDFMKNENESIVVKLGRFITEEQRWELSKKTWRIRWPKGARNNWSDDLEET